MLYYAVPSDIATLDVLIRIEPCSPLWGRGGCYRDIGSVATENEHNFAGWEMFEIKRNLQYARDPSGREALPRALLSFSQGGFPLRHRTESTKINAAIAPNRPFAEPLEQVERERNNLEQAKT